MRFTDPTEAWKTEIKTAKRVLQAVCNPDAWSERLGWRHLLAASRSDADAKSESHVFECQHHHPGTLTIIASKTFMRLHVQTTSPGPYEDEDSSAPNAYHQCSARFLAD